MVLSLIAVLNVLRFRDKRLVHLEESTSTSLDLTVIQFQHTSRMHGTASIITDISLWCYKPSVYCLGDQQKVHIFDEIEEDG